MFASRITTFKCLLSKNSILLKNFKWSSVRTFSLSSTLYGEANFQKVKCKLKLSTDYLTINQNNIFPYVWLRDNCQCESCFHGESNSRIIDWKNFDVNSKPKNVTLKEQCVNIEWSDGHISLYNLNWLEERSFREEARRRYKFITYQPNKVEWSRNDFYSIFKKYDYKNLLNDNSALKKWLEQLCVNGIALVINVPPDHDSCRKLVNRVDFIRKTHYGEEFIVQSKPGTTNVAYMSSNLQLHTDLPYYEYKPGANLLHCVTQTKSSGGENLLCDGLYVAKLLKEYHKTEYQILSTTYVEWEDIGEEKNNKFHTIHRAPVIQENNEGAISRISYSIPQRGSHLDVPVETVKPWYDSLKLFVNKIHEHSVQYKMSEGEILCFDNRRLLHGRSEYEDTLVNTRYVIGAYLDWDNIYSRLRVLSDR